MIYLDTSAFVKTVLREGESAALAEYLGQRAGVPLVSSTLLVIEARRTALRAQPDALPRTDLALARLNPVTMTDMIATAASRLPDPTLRSLDAIHLATAQALRPELDTLVTYDLRLADAARAHGLTVAAPA